MASTKPRFKIRRGGLNYRPGRSNTEKRVEVDDIVDDIPRRDVAWLHAAGYLEPTNGPARKLVGDDADDGDEEG